MLWAKGQPGNTKDRKPGAGKIESLHKKLESHIPDVLDALGSQASPPRTFVPVAG